MRDKDKDTHTRSYSFRMFWQNIEWKHVFDWFYSISKIVIQRALYVYAMLMHVTTSFFNKNIRIQWPGCVWVCVLLYTSMLNGTNAKFSLKLCFDMISLWESVPYRKWLCADYFLYNVLRGYYCKVGISHRVSLYV